MIDEMVRARLKGTNLSQLGGAYRRMKDMEAMCVLASATVERSYDGEIHAKQVTRGVPKRFTKRVTKK